MMSLACFLSHMEIEIKRKKDDLKVVEGLLGKGKETRKEGREGTVKKGRQEGGYSKSTIYAWMGWQRAQVLEHLSNKLEAPSSHPSLAKKKKNTCTYICISIYRYR
jgi:hypothetical protein